MHRQREQIFFSGRKGIVAIAIRTGVEIVPTYFLGQSQVRLRAGRLDVCMGLRGKPLQDCDKVAAQWDHEGCVEYFTWVNDSASICAVPALPMSAKLCLREGCHPADVRLLGVRDAVAAPARVPGRVLGPLGPAAAAQDGHHRARGGAHLSRPGAISAAALMPVASAFEQLPACTRV